VRSIRDWTEADLKRFVANMFKAQPAGLPRSLKLQELEVTERLSLTDQVTASPQALEYLRGGRFLALWQETVPLTQDNAVTWIVPTVGTRIKTYSLDRAFFHMEVAEPADVTVRIEKSPSGGVFDPTTVADLTIPPGDFEVVVDSGLGQISSGELLRIVWLEPGTTADVPFIVQLEGVQQ
jgi:hypothetical protein